MFKTKAELVLEMILHAKNNSIPFGWIGMDFFYGEQPWFRNEIISIIYLIDDGLQKDDLYHRYIDKHQSLVE